MRFAALAVTSSKEAHGSSAVTRRRSVRWEILFGCSCWAALPRCQGLTVMECNIAASGTWSRVCRCEGATGVNGARERISRRRHGPNRMCVPRAPAVRERQNPCVGRGAVGVVEVWWWLRKVNVWARGYQRELASAGCEVTAAHSKRRRANPMETKHGQWVTSFFSGFFFALFFPFFSSSPSLGCAPCARAKCGWQVGKLLLSSPR